jgi:hypothetical protein
MEIAGVTSFLIHPGKNLAKLPDNLGTVLPLSGKLYEMLDQVYKRSDQECNIPIRFLPDGDGSQRNEVRDLIISYLKCPDINTGMNIANRLCQFTTNIPGLGLLFIIIGIESNNRKILLSRFPAEKGILAEAQEHGLRVEFIERVFMKSTLRYKAALYSGSSLTTGFWSGFAIDKQLNTSNNEIADYWIREFLLSDFVTTSKAGTRRLAIAVREASKSTQSPSVKREVVSFGILISGLSGRPTSIKELTEKYGLSNEATAEITSHLEHEGLLHDKFVLDGDVFKSHAAFASVEFDNEGILLAPVDRFNECFQREVINQESQIIRFSIEGQVVDERIRGRK